MVISNFGKSGLALLMSPSGTIPRYCAIGSGSGAELNTLGSLIAEVLAQRTDFTSRDIGTARLVNWIFDFSSTVMSGITLREFGIGQSQTKGTNDLWNREVMAGNGVEFDGSNELQIDITFEVF